MGIRVVFLTILSFLSVTGFSQTDDHGSANLQNLTPDEELYYKGNQAALDQDYETVLKIFNEYLVRNNHNEHAYLLRSQANSFYKNYYEVVKDCKKVLSLGTTRTEFDYTAMWNMGHAYVGLGKYKLALNYLEICKKHAPGEVKFYETKAYVYFAKKDYKSAMLELEQLKKIYPASVKAHYGIAKALYMQKKLPEALEVYNKTIELDPAYAMAYQDRAIVKLALNDLEGCCNDWKKCLELGLSSPRQELSYYCE